MQYIQVKIPSADIALQEILVAELAADGYEGFVQGDDDLLAYISVDVFKEAALQQVLGRHQLNYTTEAIAEQNWNQVWEENFEPVIVKGFCTVRADFHNIQIDTPFEIVITPKMSFGTGHHATTQLMMMQMKGLDLAGKHILDFGTGTGILAILAEKLGASDIQAIDNDEWSYENAKENIERNECRYVNMQRGSLEIINEGQFDVILANINRNVLLMYMEQIPGLLKQDGKILMSGLLKEDRPVIIEAAEHAGLALLSEDELNNWITLLFDRG